jgi:hypothetical protein
MMQRLGRVITCLAVMCLLTGCSHESWTKTEELTRGASLLNPLLFPVNLMAHAGKAIVRPDGQSGGDSHRGRPFVLSERLLADFSSDASIMAAVLSIQDMYTHRNLGGSRHDQDLVNNTLKPDQRGVRERYPLGQSFIVVTNDGYEYKVRYEDESE